MAETEPQKHLVIGLPEAGKTTFLAALWHVAESGEVPDSLSLTKLQGDLSHLNKIRDTWLGCSPVGRTQQASQTATMVQTVLSLNDPISGQTSEVIFPDVAGEVFSIQWEKRQCSKEYDELMAHAGGLLLFIHSVKVNQPERIGKKVQDLIEALGEDDEVLATTSPQIEVSGNPTPWSPERSPTQVQLVDLLQTVIRRSRHRIPLRLAVIISAWDLVAQTQLPTRNLQQAPSDWLKTRLPFLDQFLTSNGDKLEKRVYGVSASGGDYSTQQDQLLKALISSQRIVVEGESCGKHDITAPVRWVMRLPDKKGFSTDDRTL